jgi:hypothetical protein
MRATHVLSALSVVLGVVMIGSFGYIYYAWENAHEVISADQADEAARAQKEQQIDNALQQLPVSRVDIEKGFWYSVTNPDGTDSVDFLDPKKLLDSGISEKQLAELVARLKSSHLVSKDNMKTVSEEELPAWADFHNKLYSFSGPGDFQNTQKVLEKRVVSSTTTTDDLSSLAYLYELKGDYAKRDKLNSQNCTQFKVNCPDKKNNATIAGIIKDMQNIPIQDATIEVLGKDVKTVTTDSKGQYSITVPVHPPEKIRIRGLKRNFSDGIASVLVAPGMTGTRQAPPIVLTSPLSVVTINPKKGTVTGDKNTHEPDGSFIVHSPHATYHIPANAVVDAVGKPYMGDIDIYLYEFDNRTIPASLANIDTFDQVMGYAGNLMKSFGMPYIQFFTTDGKELFVQKSNPMALTYTIANMADLRSNKAHIYGPLTDADMLQLITASKTAKGYPIDRAWLIDHQLLRFPAFWVFDRKKGVWEAIGTRVLDMNGTIEAPFYTINNVTN